MVLSADKLLLNVQVSAPIPPKAVTGVSPGVRSSRESKGERGADDQVASLTLGHHCDTALLAAVHYPGAKLWGVHGVDGVRGSAACWMRGTRGLTAPRSARTRKAIPPRRLASVLGR